MNLLSPLMCDLNTLRQPLEKMFDVQAVLEALAKEKTKPLTYKEIFDFVVKYGPYSDPDRALLLGHQPRRATEDDVKMFDRYNLRSRAQCKQKKDELQKNILHLTADEKRKLEICQAQYSWLTNHKFRISKSIDEYLKNLLGLVGSTILDENSIVFLLNRKFPPK